MNKELLLTGLLLLTGTFSVTAQPACCGDNKSASPAVNLTGETYNPVRLPDSSTYYNRFWLPAMVRLNTGETAHNVFLRYSKLTDDLFWFEPHNRITVRLDKEPVIGFHFLSVDGDTSISFRRIKIKTLLVADSVSVFAEEIYRGRISMYVRRGCEPDRQELVTQKGSTYLVSHYRDLPAYFVKTSAGRMVEITGLRKKDLVSLSPENKDRIRKYLNQNRGLASGRKNDLAALAGFLETLGI
jgi:hypothetical protein